MIVIVPRAVSCDCLAQENVTVTMPSGICVIPNSNPVQTWDCYTKTETPVNPPPVQPNGRCYVKPNCEQIAQPCSFRGFNITITQRTCVTDCCAGGAGRVTLDGVAQGGIAAGGTVGPIKCDPGALSCGKVATNVVAVKCGGTGAVVFRVQATFDCNDCTANDTDG